MSKAPISKPAAGTKVFITDGYQPMTGSATAGHQPTTSQGKPATLPSGGSGGKKK